MNWIRHNPITVLAAVGVVASLALLVLLMQQRPKVVSKMEQEPRTFIERAQRLAATPVTLPGPEPDSPPVQMQTVPTRELISILTDIYGKGGLEALRMETSLTAINRVADRRLVLEDLDAGMNEQQMLERFLDGDPDLTQDLIDSFLSGARNAGAGRHDRIHPHLFPAAREGRPLEVVLAEAEEEIRSTLRAMLGRGSGRWHGLRAGPGLDEEQRQAILDETRRQFLREKGITDPREGESPEAQLTSEERRELRGRQSRHLRKEIQERAEQLGVYAQTSSQPAETYPFELPDWFRERRPQTLAEAWRLQHDLWIYQDLVTAIHRANKLDDADNDLTRQPVKRLIRMRVLPGYVGAGGPSGVLEGDRGRDRTAGRDQRWEGGFETGRDAAARGFPAADAGDERDAPLRLPVDFSLTPTGRVTAGPVPAGNDMGYGGRNGGGERVINPLYLVRHAELSLIVDQRQLPALLRAIDETNLMTILSSNMRAVDPYDHLAQGYWYGEEGELVRLDMVIESLWLRSWLAPGPDPREHGGLMPSSVRREIGIAPRPDRDDDARDAPRFPDEQFRDRRGREDEFWDEAY